MPEFRWHDQSEFREIIILRNSCFLLNLIFYHLWIINIPISLNFHSNLPKLVHTFYTSLSILLDVKEESVLEYVPLFV